jgi:predicted nucleic acid-binding protein
VIVLDANILVSAVAGKRTKRVLAEAVQRGVTLAATESQFLEAARVLVEKIGAPPADARLGLNALMAVVTPLAAESFVSMETAARRRLHARAQPDWPVLAAALACDGGIWSEDRDFFGVGAPVWSSRNMAYA